MHMAKKEQCKKLTEDLENNCMKQMKNNCPKTADDAQFSSTNCKDRSKHAKKKQDSLIGGATFHNQGDQPCWKHGKQHGKEC